MAKNTTKNVTFTHLGLLFTKFILEVHDFFFFTLEINFLNYIK